MAKRAARSRAPLRPCPNATFFCHPNIYCYLCSENQATRTFAAAYRHKRHYMTQDAYHSRVSPRADFHDYLGGAYFVTICTADKAHYFGEISGGAMRPSPLGVVCERQLREASLHHPNVSIPLFVVMPNHLHAVVRIDAAPHAGVPMRATLGVVVGAIKREVTLFARLHGLPFVWQGRYYDRIIRKDEDGNAIARYIANNVAAWSQDVFHTEP